MAQLGSARRSGRRGRRFNSFHPDVIDYLFRQLVDPAFLFFLLFIALLIISWRGSLRARRRFITIFILLVLLFSNNWIAAFVTKPLESYGLKNSVLADASTRTAIKCDEYSGVIALGGVIGSADFQREKGIALLSGAERVLEPVVLSKLCPKFKLIYSSFGPKQGGAIGESELAKRIWLSLGVKSDSIIIENTSNNTYENAIQTKKLLGNEGNWLLVTSAVHMRRANESFSRAGLKVTPVPVDYIWSKTPQPWSFSFSLALDSWRAISHEYIGYLYYKVRGWI